MKLSKLLLLSALAFLSLILPSCEIVGSIFKAGMGFGIFIVLAIIIGIIVLITRSTKK